jgi:multicomponent K+:H+ antiporter subunit D
MTGAHWIVAPVVLPMLAGALLLLIERRQPRFTARLSFIATALQLAIAVGLAVAASDGTVRSYLLGNWSAPFGIALALDRLSALMLVLTALVALAAVLYAGTGRDHSRIDRLGPHFHALFQFQLMGLNGAFLTADLFNLFVFFEVLLIASYGLLLHAGGERRLRAAIHYVAFNLTGSSLFLIAVASLYGLTGTLNMADLAQRVPALAPQDALLARSAALLLLVVFCVKAALLPLYFWLPAAYGAAAAPVAALFAIMTKVGVYAVARMFTLVFGAAGGPVADVGVPWLTVLALATLVLAAIGALAAHHFRVLIGYLVIGSAGTLLLAVGLGEPETVAAGLFYLVNSTLVVAVLYLLVDRVDAQRGESADQLVPAHFGPERSTLGALYFVAAIAVCGLPPLAGFLGKSLLLAAAWHTAYAAWVWAIVLGSSLAVIISMARAGSRVFWKPALAGSALPARTAATAPAQFVAVGFLLALLLASAAGAGALARYTNAAAEQLFERRPYIDAVLGATPVTPALPIREIIGDKPKDRR